MKIHYALVIIAALFFGEANANDPVKVIFDSDMAGDCDDAGALAMLHALADNGEAELLAVMISSGAHHSAGAADVINTYYGRPNIPIGAYKGDRETGAGRYSRQIATGFPNDVNNRDNVPDAVTLYRQILSKQADRSVTIVTVGFLVNIEQLLKSGPDRHSPLNGYDLVSAKVNVMVSMAGKIPEGLEFNIYRMADVSSYVVENWPIEVVFSGAEIGAIIDTGAGLFSDTPLDNPVREVYRLYVGEGNNRHSWDQTAVLYAVRGLRDYWRLEEHGYMQVRESDGYNWWRTDADKNHRYLVMQQTGPQLAGIIEALMVQSPSLSPDKKPVGHWTFDGNTDDSAGRNHGVLKGGRYADGAMHQAIELNGVDANVEIASGQGLSLTTFTLSAWVKIPVSIQPGWRVIMEHDRFGSNWYGLYKSERGDKFHFRWADSGVATADFNATIYPETWYHVAGTFENGTAKMYLDGKLDHTVTGATIPTYNDAGLRIGQNQAGNEAFKAVIDDVRIYGMALSDQGVVDLYDERITPADPPPPDNNEDDPSEPNAPDDSSEPNEPNDPSESNDSNGSSDSDGTNSSTENGGCFISVAIYLG